MKKRLVAVMLVLLVLLPVTVFAGGAKEGSGEEKKVEVVKIFNSMGGRMALLEAAIVKWNDTTGKEKGIRIDIETNINKYREVLEIALKAGNHPDLFNIDGVVPAYVSNGWAKAIEDVDGGKEFLDANYKGMLKNIMHQYKGKTYTLPYEFLPIKLAYNKDLFKKAGIVDASGEAKPPKTWTEVVDYAKRITDAGGGVEYGYGFTYAWAAGFRRLLVKSYIPSVGHFWFDHNTGKYNFSAFAPVFHHLLQMKEDGSLFPGPESIQIDPIRAQFAEGRIGMMTAPAYDVNVYNDQFPAKCDWSVVDLPVEDLNGPRYKEPALERAHFGMSSEIPEEKEQVVFTVYKWLFSDELLKSFYEAGNLIPYKPEIIEMAGEPKEKTGWKEFSGNLGINYGLFPYPDTMVSVDGKSYNQVFESIFIGQVGVEEGLADLDARYNKALEAAIKEGKFERENYMFDADLRLK